MKQIVANEMQRLLEQGQELRIVDVRSPAEFRVENVPGSINLPLNELEESISQAVPDRHERIHLICASGARSGKACDLLDSLGYTDVVSIKGGITDWKKVGFELSLGEGGISIERQVRIAAGGLVLLGVGMSYLLHPAFIGLSAFVGAGLVFAGTTGTCGMEKLLARMPWNK